MQLSGPIAVIRVRIILDIIHHASDVDTSLEQRGLVGHGDQGEETTITKSPNLNSIGIDVRQSFYKIGGHPGILGVLPHVHVDAFAPIPAVANAPAIIGSEDDMPLLKQILVKAVIDGVVPLQVPAVVILVHAVAVDPDDGRMFFERSRFRGTWSSAQL